MSIMEQHVVEGIEPAQVGCRSCGAELARAALTLCGECWSRLAEALGRLDELAADLELAVRRGGRFGDGRLPVRSGVPAGSAGVIPFDTRASVASATLRTARQAWATALGGGERVIRRHPAAGELVRDVLGASRLGWLAVDRPAERVFLGLCSARIELEVGETAECPTDVWAAEGDNWARCGGCGARHSVEWRRERLLGAVADQRLTAAEAGAALPRILVGWQLADGRHVPVDYLPAWADFDEDAEDGQPAAVYVAVTSAQIRNYASRGRLVAEGGKFLVSDVVDAVRAAWRYRMDIG